MRILALAAALVFVPTLLLAEETQKTDEKFVSLFDGKSLDGWKVEKCDVTVEDGCIFLKGGNGWMHTDKQYADFVLELDWKSVKTAKYDSGVYIRAVAIKPRQNWPAKNQINLREDLMGNIQEIKATGSHTDMVKAGEWNHFRVTVIGETCSLEINGKPAWKLENFKPATGYIGLQCEVPAGGQFYFKNVRIAQK
jgi:hypothetical protein